MKNYLIDLGLQEHQALLHTLLVCFSAECVLYFLNLELQVFEVVLALHVVQIIVQPRLQVVLYFIHVFFHRRFLMSACLSASGSLDHGQLIVFVIITDRILASHHFLQVVHSLHEFPKSIIFLEFSLSQ